METITKEELIMAIEILKQEKPTEKKYIYIYLYISGNGTTTPDQTNERNSQGNEKTTLANLI